MRVLVDPDTGELVEVVEEAVLDLTPYDYRQAKAAAMRQSTEKRKALTEYREAVIEKAAAERAYRSLLSRAILTAKAEEGATVAESLAKGREDVAEAKERSTIAEGMVIAAYQKLLLCAEDKQSIVQLTAWSRSVDPNAFQGAGA